jgi:hypothetical protein
LRGIVIARRLFQPTACPDFRGSNLTTIATNVRFKNDNDMDKKVEKPFNPERAFS